jgi:multisubunit Na+/H+ antiporter MnhG subunit
MLKLAHQDLYMRNVANSIVATLGVVEHLYAIDIIRPNIMPGWINLAANPVTLERLEETLGHRGVMTVTPTAHAE